MLELETLALGLVSVVAMMLVVFRLIPDASSRRRCAVVVLGDFGRSPRMQNHCHSLATCGAFDDVAAIAYGGSSPHPRLAQLSNFRFVQVSEQKKAKASKFVFLLQAPFRIAAQTLKLFWALTFRVGRAQFVLVQNPPSIPTLLVARVATWIYGTTLVIDWHNYGYSILALTVGQRHWATRIARLYEKLLGRLADRHLCVTDAMKDDLRQHWSVNAATLHDSPPPFFQPATADERARVFGELAVVHPSTFTPLLDACARLSKKPWHPSRSDETWKWERPALLVSSTSWTEDEDFSILLEALLQYDQRCQQDGNLPKLVCAITGKGPLKEYYEGKIQEAKMKSVQVVTVWLTAEMYPLLLGSADLGVCLHKSSSGLDLPMKVVDMFGCALPVCAVNFACLAELVKHEQNGLVFQDALQLASQIERLLLHPTELAQLREGTKEFAAVRWEQRWNENARRVFFM